MGGRLARYEVLVARRESEIFNTAVYRFIEIQTGIGGDELVKVHTEPHGEFEKKELTLWSEDAVRDFAAFWNGFSKPAGPGVNGTRGR